MEKIMRKRAIALTMIMGLAMISLISLVSIAVPLPDASEWEVIIEDEAGTMDDTDTYLDMKGYLGEDFMFGIDAQPFVDESDIANVTDNVTAYIKIGTGVDDTMLFWDLSFLDAGVWWLYTWEADTLGMIDWEINVTDDDMNWTVKSGQLEVLEPVMYVTAFDDSGEVDEDMTLTWNFTGAFTPAEGLEYDFDWPVGWTVVEVDDMVYNITPPAEFNGEVSFAVNASDADYHGYYTHNFTIDVQAVNDAPMLYNIIMDDVVYEAEEKNITTEVDENGTALNWTHKMVIVLPFEEDGGVYNFTVNATDIDSNVSLLEYEFDEDATLYDISAWDEMAYMFNFTPAANANGEIEAMLNISDPEGGYYTMCVWFDVAEINDAPTATKDWDMKYDLKTGVELNLTVSDIADIDGDDVTVMWYIDGTMVADWEEVYFAYTWDMPGMYNVSAKITDGVETIDVGYFMANVSIANTAPEITDVAAAPVDIDPFDVFDFYLLGEVEEGEDVELTCDATDAEGDELTYTWTNNQDSAWSATGDTVVVPADYLQKGLTYMFTVVVSDGTATATGDSNNITIVEADDEESFFESLGIACLIIMIGIPLLIIVVIIVIVMKKKGKKEEEAPEEQPPMEEEMPMEGGEEMPMEGEVPMEEGMEEPMMEQPVAEEPVAAPEEPVPAPEEPVPAPEEPVTPEEPVAAPEEPVPAPEEPPAPPEPPMPPQ